MTRHLSISFALLLIFNPAVHSQTPPASPEHKLIDDIKAHTSGMAIWWTGHNGWLIKQDSILIGTDLVLENEDRQSPAPVSAAEIAPLLDISFITHEHGDHIGGLMEGATPTFANAAYLTGAVEFDAWDMAGNETFEAKVRPLAGKTTMLDAGASEIRIGSLLNTDCK